MSICILITLFGAAVVVLIQCSDFVTSLINHHDWGVREVLPIIAAAVLPVLFLGTPKDFWFDKPSLIFSLSYITFSTHFFLRPVGIAALMSTTLACAFILIQLIKTSLTRHDTSSGDDHTVAANGGGSVTFDSFSLSFATILFSFGGASTFPTIQNDMKQKGKFYVSVLMCFSSEYDVGDKRFSYALVPRMKHQFTSQH